MVDDEARCSDVDDGEDLVWHARTDDGRRITSILSSICLSTTSSGRYYQRDGGGTLAWCEVSDQGITVTVNVAKTLQAIAYVKRQGVFHTWQLAEVHMGNHPEERLEFGINLATLLQCLKIFGGASGAMERTQAALHMNFRRSSLCLGLMLNEKYSVTECEIHSLDIDAPHRVELNVREGEKPPVRIVINSEDLKAGIDELEWGGDNGRDKRVHLRVNRHPGSLSLIVSSTDIGCEMVYPKEALVSFEASSDFAFEYRFQHLHMALHALKDSHQTQLQLDEQGTLEIKMRFASQAVAKGSELFSHFFLFPLADEDDQDVSAADADALEF